MFKWLKSLTVNKKKAAPKVRSGRCGNRFYGGVHVNIVTADGGHVVEVGDPGSLFIVTNDKDLGDELSKIVTLVLLRDD